MEHVGAALCRCASLCRIGASQRHHSSIMQGLRIVDCRPRGLRPLLATPAVLDLAGGDVAALRPKWIKWRDSEES